MTFNSDQFAMFKQGDSVTPEQTALAEAIMSPEFQIAFNKVKGSVPARTDVSVDELRRLRPEGLRGAEGGLRVAATCSARWRTATPTRRR